jgi:GT2 family glycosyltransferase
LGGFDARFFSYSEDVDLGFRLLLSGGRSIQVPDAIVHHVGGGSAGRRSPFKTYYAARNRVWTFVKNMPGPLFWLLLPLHAAMNLAALAHAALVGVFPDTARGIGDALKGLPEILKAREAIQAARKASMAQIAAALTWSPLAVAHRRLKMRR